MNHTVGGLLLAFAGLLLGILTYKKWSIFWDFLETRFFRKYLGDETTATILYVLSVVLIAVGLLVAAGFIA